MHGWIKICFSLRTVFFFLTSAYLAAVNAACERAPMIYPRAVSDGQFYSPPESIAGDVCLCSCSSAPSTICVSFFIYYLKDTLILSLNFFLQALRRIWMRRVLGAELSLHR